MCSHAVLVHEGRFNIFLMWSNDVHSDMRAAVRPREWQRYRGTADPSQSLDTEQTRLRLAGSIGAAQLATMDSVSFTKPSPDQSASDCQALPGPLLGIYGFALHAHQFLVGCEIW